MAIHQHKKYRYVNIKFHFDKIMGFLTRPIKRFDKQLVSTLIVSRSLLLRH